MLTLSRAATFRLVTAAMFAVMIAAGAPSPLYGVYQQRIGFSAAVLTEIFAIYVVTLLATLLTVGSLSDHIGRRPVLLAALSVQVVGLLLYLPADAVWWLMLARAVQGVATGASIGALGAALVDTQPPGTQHGMLLNSVAPGLGLAAGALGAGALLQYAPSPTTTVFVVLVTITVLISLGLAAMPETTSRNPGALRSLRPQVRVHQDVRPAFYLAAPVFGVSWAVGGLYLSLGGSLASSVFGLHNHVTAGLVVAAMTGTGGIAAYLLRNGSPASSMTVGSAALGSGLAVTVAGIALNSTLWFFVGTVVAGFGFGASFLGAFRTVAGSVPAADRAATLAAVLVVAYSAFAIPAVVAGAVATKVGLRDTALGYGLLVIGVSAVSVGLQLLQRRRSADAPDPYTELLALDTSECQTDRLHVSRTE